MRVLCSTLSEGSVDAFLARCSMRRSPHRDDNSVDYLSFVCGMNDSNRTKMTLFLLTVMGLQAPLFRVVDCPVCVTGRTFSSTPMV